nr:MAG TPA: hypothetical protein [Caudoviricetes sp.]
MYILFISFCKECLIYLDALLFYNKYKIIFHK